MVRHIVFWNLKEEALGATKKENMEKMREELEALNGKIEGTLMIQVNENFNPQGYDLCLYSEFVNEEALTYYQKHPLHTALLDFIREVTAERVVTDCFL